MLHVRTADFQLFKRTLPWDSSFQHESGWSFQQGRQRQHSLLCPPLCLLNRLATIHQKNLFPGWPLNCGGESKELCWSIHRNVRSPCIIKLKGIWLKRIYASVIEVYRLLIFVGGCQSQIFGVYCVLGIFGHCNLQWYGKSSWKKDASIYIPSQS